MNEDRASLFRFWAVASNPKLWASLGTVCSFVVAFLYRMTAAELESMHARDDAAQAAIKSLQDAAATEKAAREAQDEALRLALIEAEAARVRVQASDAERDARKRAQTGANAERDFRELIDKGKPIDLAARMALETKPPSR